MSLDANCKQCGWGEGHPGLPGENHGPDPFRCELPAARSGDGRTRELPSCPMSVEIAECRLGCFAVVLHAGLLTLKCQERATRPGARLWTLPVEGGVADSLKSGRSAVRSCP